MSRPTAAQEAAFMASLLGDIDSTPTHPPPSSLATSTTTSTFNGISTSSTASISRTSSTSTSASSATAVDNDFDMAAFMEGCDDWDLDDIQLTPVKPVKTAKPPRPQATTPPYNPDPCTRCVVDSVVEEQVDRQWRKSISARIESNGQSVTVYLYNDWFYTDIRTDDIFNVIGTFSTPPVSSSAQALLPCISITAASNMIILHPDLLLTATALSNAPQCRRKPILSSLIRSTSDISPALVYGNVLHEVMQSCLREQQWDDKFLDKAIAEAVAASLGDLVQLGITEEVAQRDAKERAKGVQLFAKRYMHDEPQPDGALANTRSRANDEPSLLAITKLLDVEEDIWSPTFGLKGKLDATVQAIISEPIPSATPSSHSTSTSGPYRRTLKSLPFPLELKTGKATMGLEHRAQTMLYTLLVSEKYGADVSDGLLFYTQSEAGDLVRVPRGANEIRGLLGARNEIAGYMWRRIRRNKRGVRMLLDDEEAANVSLDASAAEKAEIDVEEAFLPPPIDDERACMRCYVQDACMLFRKANPNHHISPSAAQAQRRFDPPIPSFLADVFDAKTGHLTPLQVEFFRGWERLLALEEKDLVRFKRELWTVGAEERERKGRCFSGMVLVSGGRAADYSAVAVGGGPVGDAKIHRYTYSFARSKKRGQSASPGSTWTIDNLLSGHLGVNDPVTVSAEPLLALARGFIVELTPEQVVLGVDHDLDLLDIRAKIREEKRRRLKHTSRCHDQGVVDVSMGSDADADDVFSTPAEEELIFRIDKDELFGGMSKVRNNLATMFFAGGDKRRLELVVDLRKPTFSAPQPPFESGNLALSLNPCQLGAMEKVLSADDYALVLGMPGTGKTTVIAALIQELVKRGKTVLLSSYTHSAVDTILMKLDGHGGSSSGLNADEDGNGKETFGILRIGNTDKVHPDVRKYTLGARKSARSVEQLERQLMAPPVVATTCLSIDHPLFSRRQFDYCIVDEASQITLPTCLGPLRFADKFVLVGDHFQLPPLVKNPDARKGGLDISLFRRLSDAHPEAVVDLKYQYRMNADIMLLSNRLIYDNRLSCGNAEVARRALNVPQKMFLGRLHATPEAGGCEGGCWLKKLASESCKAVFVDTDALPARDSRVGDLPQNTTEAELVRQFAETLLMSGVEESQIGIISIYRQQVKLLQHLLRDRQGVEILTADKSQGRDKDCIIISLVRSNEEGHIGDLVKDWRRMNVSFTRARRKLVIFGSRKTLRRERLLAEFFELMEEKGWIMALPPGADTAHARVFDGPSASPAPTQSQSQGTQTSVKRSADDVDGAGKEETGKAEKERKQGLLRLDGRGRLVVVGKENATAAAARAKKEKEEKESRPTKKLKMAKPKPAPTNKKDGILKGRPILRDLVGGDQF